VKVDAKTKSLLDEHKQKKKIAERERKDSEEEEGETKGSDDDEDDVGEFALREDDIARIGLNGIMSEFADDLSRDPPGGDFCVVIIFVTNKQQQWFACWPLCAY